ncbi:unnamed protein product [Blepharisma stoltei]|uniref:Uncharacterized protein n=1 Tax=Blepharisma stoltei TaxID=1481888 RepID=A0AAU9K4S9_9CILI|nr:unnamed protein product [Blepharisma stoltei]
MSYQSSKRNLLSSQELFYNSPENTKISASSIAKSANKYRSPDSTPVRTRCHSSNAFKPSLPNEIPKEVTCFELLSTDDSDVKTFSQQSPVPSCQSRLHRIEKIDNLIDKFKRDISAHSLRTFDHDRRYSPIKSYSEDKKKILISAEKKNRELRKRLKILEDSAEEKIQAENKHLLDYLSSNLESRRVLEEEIKALEKINMELENTPQHLNEEELNEKNKELKMQSHFLAKQLKALQETKISPSDYNLFLAELKTLETTQEALIIENELLKKQLFTTKKEDVTQLSIKNEIETHSKEISFIHKEITLLKNIAESILTGKSVSLGLLLGSKQQTEYNDDKDITESIAAIKNELSSISSLICEIQSEIPTKNCAVH